MDSSNADAIDLNSERSGGCGAGDAQQQRCREGRSLQQSVLAQHIRLLHHLAKSS
jgi:hypothetical protein